MKNTNPLYTQDCFHNLIGLDYSEVDCYELAIRFYKIIFHHDLDLLYDIRPSTTETEAMFNKQKKRFHRVDDPKFGDIIVFNVIGLACHIGIYIDESRFLHTRKETGSVIERSVKWQKRVEGYYRWPQLKLGLIH